MTTTTSKDMDITIDTSRRQAMGILGAISALGVTGLLSYSEKRSNLFDAVATNSSLPETSKVNNHVLIPSETLATFPLATFLNNSSFLREAINEDKEGVPLTVKLKLVNVNDNDKPISGYVYVWHCDNDGLYSGYDSKDNVGQAGKTYCRGLQYTDANGQAMFTTIYPGFNEQSIPHINFQIFLTTSSNSTSSSVISQMTFPADVISDVYNSNVYGKADNIFSDEAAYQVATITGNVVDGYVAELQVGIAVS